MTLARRFTCSNFQRKHENLVDPKQTVGGDGIAKPVERVPLVLIGCGFSDILVMFGVQRII